MERWVNGLGIKSGNEVIGELCVIVLSTPVCLPATHLCHFGCASFPVRDKKRG